MNTNKFFSLENYKSGTYDDCGDFKAFNPSFINQTWNWADADLNYLLAEANKELGALNTYSELIENIDVYILMHIQVEANKSSRIEGTRTSIEEDMMNIDDVLPEKKDDVQEIQNYVTALNYGIDRIQNDEFPFTSRLIRELHEKLMAGVRGQHKTPGEFRHSQNFIGGSRPSNAAYVPPTVNRLPELMSDFDKFMNSDFNMPILMKLAIMHYQFETIHPFLDGNGRTGRLIIPLYLLSSKEITKPCFYISSYFETNKDDYYKLLQNVRTNSEIIPWIKFFLRASIETAKSAKDKFKRALQVQRDYQNYLMQKRYSTETLREIISYMYRNPVTSALQISKHINVSLPTVNKHLSTLRTDGVIDEITGNKRNKLYALRKYIKAFI